MASVEAGYVLTVALRRKHRDALIACVGFLPYLVGCLWFFASRDDAVLQLGIPWLILVMSVHLARRVARTYTELEERNQEIAAASQNKSTFLASMSHELRTPMNAIKGFTNLVAHREQNLSDRGKDNLEKVDQASDHLMAMINDLLDLSKIEAGRMDVNPERFDVKELIASACDTVSPLIQEGVELRQEVDDSIGEANTDWARVQQMVINLVSNAIKFTDSGSVTVSVTREPGPGTRKPLGDSPAHGSRPTDDGSSASELVIAVSDTGKGIPSDELPTIFDEYRQAEGSESSVQKGTGLGLSITKRFAELLGGSIDVKSELA